MNRSYVIIPHRTSPTCLTKTKHPSVKYNRVISPGISHIARESVIAENGTVGDYRDFYACY